MRWPSLNIDGRALLGAAALVVFATGCPGGDDGAASTSGPDDSSSGPGGGTVPDPSVSTTVPGSDGTTTAAPSSDSSSGGASTSDTGEPDTSSGSSSTGGEPGATPCQGKPVVHVPEVTRVAGHVPPAGPTGVGDLQDDVDPIEGGSGSSGDGGIGFIVEPDGGGVAFECDPIAQDCPPGEKCAPWANDGSPSWNATHCVPVAPDPGAPGDPCTVEGSGVSGIDDCELGALCFGVDENGMGTCVEMCGGTPVNPTCEAPGTTCVITNDGALTLCQPLCNPLADECAPNEGCYLVGQFTVCAPDASGDMGGAGDPCEYLNACDDGQSCAGAQGVPRCSGSSGCCTPFCTLGDDSGCLEGQMCVPVYEDGQAPLECVAELGICILP